ncbi:hypothetical protein GCM10009765_23600 [Fodinicola feengrottensis]|uniref:Replication-relaxation n=2 Tax=Fodinicola feengrottensis TaxID=435914 RepID=A0ABP4SKE1_9ACTN
MRLNRLRRAGLITRFRWHPGTGGSQPWHYTIDDAGAALIAAERELVLASGNALRVRRAVLAASPQLAHRVGANEFFVQLYAYSRTHRGQLVAWLNPEQTHEQYPPYNARLRCDGHGAWREDGRTVGFYLEYDTGTESQSVLLDKIEAYEQTTATGHLPPHPVLFWLPSTQREKNLWTAIANTRTRAPRIPIATAARDTSTGGQPASAIWALANAPGRRRRLAELPVAEPLPTPTLAHPRELLDVSILDKTAG